MLFECFARIPCPKQFLLARQILDRSVDIFVCNPGGTKAGQLLPRDLTLQDTLQDRLGRSGGWLLPNWSRERDYLFMASLWFLFYRCQLNVKEQASQPYSPSLQPGSRLSANCHGFAIVFSASGKFTIQLYHGKRDKTGPNQTKLYDSLI